MIYIINIIETLNKVFVGIELFEHVRNLRLIQPMIITLEGG